MPAFALVCALTLCVGAQTAPAERAGAAHAENGPPAARGLDGLTIGRAQLEVTLLERYAYSENGRELLDLFLKARLLETLAVQRGVRVSDAEVTRRWQELEKRSRAEGRTLQDEIRQRGLTPEQFRDFLRLALVQERLAREALGIPRDAEISGDKQELWIQQEIAQRGFELKPPPDTPAADPRTDVLARCGDISVTREEFGRFLHERLGRDSVKESAWHLLLVEALDKRMPDLAPEARGRAIEEELERRRRKHATEYPTISFEQRLGATGRTLATVRNDPSLAIAALTRLWVDRTAGGSGGRDGLRSAYEKERDLFDGRFGEAVRAALVFRVAGRFVNDLCPRTFEQAEQELAREAERCRTLDDFAELVERYSEEPNTKKQKGDMGWVTRGDARVPAALREALFHMLDTGGEIPEGGRSLGPVRLDAGVALLWASERRPSPSWEEMSERVHEELRRRFIEEIMPESSVELLNTDG